MFGHVRKTGAEERTCIHPVVHASKQSESVLLVSSGVLKSDKIQELAKGHRAILRIVTESDAMTPSTEANLVGVAGLAQEIDEELRGLDERNTENLRRIRRAFSKRLENAAPHVVKELAMLLLELPGFEFRFIAYELLHHHGGALYKLNAWELEQLGRGIANWGAADCFAIYLAGPLWRERRVPNSLVHDWARSADHWWRRIALVSTVPLNSKAQGGSGDTHRTLQVCRILEKDRDPMVVKAMSWALRELAKADSRAAKSFLAERQTLLAPRVLRDVQNKLATGLKDPGRSRGGASVAAVKSAQKRRT